MKIVLYLHSLAGGGAERVAVNLANHWSGLGHRVSILTVDSVSSDAYALSADVGRVSLDLAGQSRSRWRGLVANVERLTRLRRTLRGLAPDVVIGFMTTANVQLGILRGSIPGRLIGSERTHPPQMPQGRAWETLRRWCYARLDAVVALTGETSDWLRRNTRARRVELIGNPVLWPLPRQQPLLDPGVACGPDRRVVLAVGRLAEEKQLDHALRAMAAIAGVHPSWDLVLLGEGPMRNALQQAVVALGLQGRVFMPGRAGNVGDWYLRADLFLMCSRFEGFPNSLAEAMASGLPAVSYDCDTGPRDIVRNGLDGLLVPAGDERALATALGELMADDGRRARFATAAVQGRERYSLAAIDGRWRSLFASLGLAVEARR